jgi:hypothetical protein
MFSFMGGWRHRFCFGHKTAITSAVWIFALGVDPFWNFSFL